MYWKIIFTIAIIVASFALYNYKEIQSCLQTLQTHENYIEESGNTLFLSKNELENILSTHSHSELRIVKGYNLGIKDFKTISLSILNSYIPLYTNSHLLLAHLFEPFYISIGSASKNIP